MMTRWFWLAVLFIVILYGGIAFTIIHVDNQIEQVVDEEGE